MDATFGIAQRLHKATFAARSWPFLLLLLLCLKLFNTTTRIRPTIREIITSDYLLVINLWSWIPTSFCVRTLENWQTWLTKGQNVKGKQRMNCQEVQLRQARRKENSEKMSGWKKTYEKGGANRNSSHLMNMVSCHQHFRALECVDGWRSGLTIDTTGQRK